MNPIALRVATPADAAAVHAIYAPYVADTVISFEIEPPSVADMRVRLEKTLARYPYLVAERDGVVVGYAYAVEQRERAAYRWNAELSVYLAREHTGRGTGRALYTTLIALLEAQNIRNVYGGITVPNPPSERLHERLGFSVLGVFHTCGYKLGRWLDVIWYEKHLGNPAEAPQPFIPFPDLPPASVVAILAAAGNSQPL